MVATDYESSIQPGDLADFTEDVLSGTNGWLITDDTPAIEWECHLSAFSDVTDPGHLRLSRSVTVPTGGEEVLAFAALVYGVSAFYHRDPLESMDRIMTGTYAPLGELRFDLSPDFCAILDDCLRLQPADRPRTAEVTERFRACLLAERMSEPHVLIEEILEETAARERDTEDVEGLGPTAIHPIDSGQ